MRTLHSDVQTALQQRGLVARDFLNVWPKNRSTGAEEEKGYWSGAGSVSASIINPLTGSTVSRNYRGVGTLIQISDIPLVSNITVQRITIRMSHIDTDVMDALRTYDLRQARVQIFRGLFNPDTRVLVNAAIPRFLGFVDGAPLETPSENEEGSFVLECVSHTQEMLRSNPDVRSDESQKRRSGTDNFYQDTATVGDRELWWGSRPGKVRAKAS
jgi:hypothetical protein